MSDRQAKTVRFVTEQLEQRGVAPTYREIAAHLSVSVSASYKIVDRLIGQRRLVRTKGHNRNLSVPGRVELRDVPSLTLKNELERRGELFESASALSVARGRECAATGCAIKVQRGHLFCIRHYRAVPRTIMGNLLNSFSRQDRKGFERWFGMAKDSLDAQGLVETVVERVQ
jgi:hypothetical protein